MAEYKQMTLGECAKHDQRTSARRRLTGWGIICKQRRELKISRKEVRKIKRAEAERKEREEA